MSVFLVETARDEALLAQFFPGTGPADGLLIGTNAERNHPVLLNRAETIKLFNFLADCLAMEEE